MQAREQLKSLLPGIQAGDAAAIHEARKLTRRIEAELALAGAPKKRRRKWRKFRRAIAPIRDQDAAGEHLQTALNELDVPQPEIQVFQQAWRAARAEALRQLKLPKLPKHFEEPENSEEELQKLLVKLSARVRRQAQQALESTDPQDWHTWRKTLKKYRYTLELAVEEAPRVLRDVLDALGRLQDADVVLGKLADKRLPIPGRERLMAREHAAREQAMQRVQRLWPRLERTLQMELSLLDGNPDPAGRV